MTTTLAGIHPRFDDLPCDATLDRLELLSHMDDAHAALTNLPLLHPL